MPTPTCTVRQTLVTPSQDVVDALLPGIVKAIAAGQTELEIPAAPRPMILDITKSDEWMSVESTGARTDIASARIAEAALPSVRLYASDPTGKLQASIGVVTLSSHKYPDAPQGTVVIHMTKRESGQAPVDEPDRYMTPEGVEITADQLGAEKLLSQDEAKVMDLGRKQRSRVRW